MYYFDAQRMKNAEFALSQGVTTVRDSGGAYDMVHGLKQEINNHKLLGPRIIPSYFAMSPKGGMWDVNPVLNKMVEMVFGGKALSFPKTSEDIKRNIDEVLALGANSIKIYLEDKPLYGGTAETVYNMLSDEEIDIVRSLADAHGKIVETHAMFIKGARRAIRGKLNSIAHLTVDESYSLEEAEMMVKNNVAIVPTFSVGSFLAMDCGSGGYPDSSEYQFFREMLKKHVKPTIKNATIPQLSDIYDGFYEFIWSEIVDREMPHVGPVYPERLHGFGVYAPKSMENFKKAGTKVGVGTDGGSGIGFSGALGLEFDALLRYGYSPKEIVRMATLGNMEIIKLDHQLGSISDGKLADMILIEDNPFENVLSMTSPVRVFKEGRCLIDTDA
jgi:imidazolonepropionase-like amidohydrolase